MTPNKFNYLSYDNGDFRKRTPKSPKDKRKFILVFTILSSLFFIAMFILNDLFTNAFLLVSALVFGYYLPKAMYILALITYDVYYLRQGYRNLFAAWDDFKQRYKREWME